jgi:hypothetical protein
MESRIDAKGAFHLMNSFGHIDESKSTVIPCFTDVKPHSSVTDLKFNSCALPLQMHLKMLSATMLDRIVQRFLNDTEESK